MKRQLLFSAVQIVLLFICEGCSKEQSNQPKQPESSWSASVRKVNALKKEQDAASAWGKAYNRPLYMGEFGSYSRADETSRAL